MFNSTLCHYILLRKTFIQLEIGTRARLRVVGNSFLRRAIMLVYILIAHFINHICCSPCCCRCYCCVYFEPIFF